MRSKKTAKKNSSVRVKKNLVKEGREVIKSFPIVGIGSSAGGIEAFSSFLQHLSPNLGMAYIYVQHLSPSHESFLPEIFQRKTSMKVVKVENNMRVEKNCVYVMPERKFIRILDGKLKLEPIDKNNPRNAIDHFFMSLAPLYKENAIGIILSGTGTDGSNGLLAIKAEGGITFAQDESANYHGMPYHAIDRGNVDFVMSPEKIAKELGSLIQYPYAVKTRNEFLHENASDLRKIHQIMHTRRGVDFSFYKQSTIGRRIMRRMALNKIKTLEEYARVLKEDRKEVDALYHDLLITVTSFFRDPAMYQVIISKVLPALLKGRRASDPVRIWIPGCATGEEAVSFAIVLLEYMGEKGITIPMQIFATDLNEKAIEKARRGIYYKGSMVNVSAQRLRRFFIKTEGEYQVVKTIRDMCVFAPHNLLKDPPFSRMDIISCQNVLIYLEAAPQQKIMQVFHYALKSSGFLLLGKSETIGSATELFEQDNKQVKLYRKRVVATPLKVDFMAKSYAPAEISEDDAKSAPVIHKDADPEKEMDKLLLNRYVPASVLVNKDLEILRFRGFISRILEPASGKASLHLLKMVNEDLAFDLRMLINRAKKEKSTVHKGGIILGANGGTKMLSIEVIPVNTNVKDGNFLIIFREESRITPTPAVKSATISQKGKGSNEKHVAALETQLKEAREHIKMMTEDFEAAREELQSANEEILSSNEELQSINEEMETSKEELQSANEELTTINDELMLRNTELKVAGDYTNAIVETINEGLIMLHADMKIKNANKGFYQMFQVTPEETEGYFLHELGNHQWDIPELRKQLKMVQSRDIPLVNFEVTHQFPGIGKKSMLINANRFMKKDSGDIMILLVIQDITVRKTMEDELRKSEEKFQLLTQNASDIITIFDQNGYIKYESPAIKTVLGYTPEERIGKNIQYDFMVHPDDRRKQAELFEKSKRNARENIYGEFRVRHKKGNYRTIDAIFRNLLDNNKVNGIIANYRDITDRKRLEQQKDEFIGIASHELKTPVTSIKAYAELLEEKFRGIKDYKSADLLHKMDVQVDRLTALIVDLLDFTRIEGGKLKFREENFDLNELIDEIIEDVQRISSTHVIEKKLDKSIELFGDRYRIGQVLTNLLSNATKYSPKAKKVIVTSTLKGRTVSVCVQDFGIGITKSQQHKVFDRFYRVSQPLMNTLPGLGLGLYIASEIVTRQGGRISVKSIKGKGSTFCFSLPVRKKGS